MACRSTAGELDVGVGEVHAGGQSPAEEEDVPDDEAASFEVARDLLSGEDPRAHFEHESV